MMFENDISPPPSKWSLIHDRLPVILLVIGAIALFFGLHMAATSVIGVAAAHVVVGVVLLAIRRLRSSGPGPEGSAL